MKDETGAECNDILEEAGRKDTPAVQAGAGADIVCPKCFKPMVATQIIPQPDRYGRKIRRYLGFCTGYNLGSEVWQFERDGRWVIHKYQVYAYVGQLTHCQASGKWVTLNDLPEPAPVVTGPGGDYDKQIKLSATDIAMLSTLQRGLECAVAALESFMRHFGIKD